MAEPTITCPSCSTEIPLTESLAAPLTRDNRRGEQNADSPRLLAPARRVRKQRRLATFLRSCREYDLALMLVWEGRSGDHRFSGPNLRKFAVYHGPDRILSGIVIVEGFGPEGIAVWRPEVTAHPEVYSNMLAGAAKALRQSAEGKRQAFARFGRILPTEELDPDDDDPEGA